MSKKHKKHHKADKSAAEDKPGLKLVLKVGTPDQGDNSSPPPEEHDGDKKHKHKKKKKKHKHHKDDDKEKKQEKKRTIEKVESADISDIDDMIEPPPKRQAMDDAPSLALGRGLRERKHMENEQTPLQRSLDYIHKLLIRKDMNGFFAFPVTDNIAPSYSKIIDHPMDFSTMREKVDTNEYTTVLDYRDDFKLMCDNCMKYNHPETIYYKEAEKLLKTGLKLMSKEKLLQLKRNMMIDASDHDLGIDIDQGEMAEDSGTPKPVTPRPKVKKTAMSKFEAFPDRLTPEQILAQAQDAAKDAAEQLTLRKPNTKFGFLRRREDGSTTLNLLNPDNDGIVSEKERVVNLGKLVGKLPSGTGSLTGFKEDKRNKALPVNYLNYGPYSSYAPVYDSSQANLSKEDSDLLIQAYGDEAGTQYAYSIRHFVKDSGDYALRMVDNLLDIITGGEHSKAVKVLDQVEETQKDQDPDPEPNTEVKSEPTEEQQQTGKDVKEEMTEDFDFSSLRSLSDLGIDTTFLDPIEDSIKQEQEFQNKLDVTSSLLQDLQKSQYDRLGQALPTHLASVSGPDDKEQNLAQKVSQELKDLVRKVNPRALVSLNSVRRSLGVSVDPIIDRTEANKETDSPWNQGTTVAAADTTTEDVVMEDPGRGSASASEINAIQDTAGVTEDGAIYNTGYDNSRNKNEESTEGSEMNTTSESIMEVDLQ